MKNFFLAAAILLSIAGNAQSNDSTRVIATVSFVKDTQKIMVAVSNPDAERITIDVYSSESGYLMSKVTKVNDYRANLDFSTAVDGDYTITVSCRGHERFQKTVCIGTRETSMRELTLR